MEKWFENLGWKKQSIVLIIFSILVLAFVVWSFATRSVEGGGAREVMLRITTSPTMTPGSVDEMFKN